jgi:hypothetical protein
MAVSTTLLALASFTAGLQTPALRTTTCHSKRALGLVTCQQQPPSAAQKPSPPIGLRCLDRQEVLDKLNAAPVFSIVNGAEQLLTVPDESGALVCRFYLELSEAQAALTDLRAANPGEKIELTVAPLGTAFALSEWEEQVDEEARGVDGLLPDIDNLQDDDDLLVDETDEGDDGDGSDDDALRTSAPASAAPSGVVVRLQAAQTEVEASKGVLAASPTPPLLRRRNQREGAVPLFGSDELRFEMPSGAEEAAGVNDGSEDEEMRAMTPLFFTREDFKTAWLSSGEAAEQLPAVQVTDLRTLAYQMQFDTSQDWRSLLLVAPEASIDFVKQQQQQQAVETQTRRNSRRTAASEDERDADKGPGLSRADLQGLLFGGKAEL